MEIRMHVRAGKRDTGQQKAAAVNDPALAAVVQLFDVRNSLAPFFLGHTGAPYFRMLLDVVIGADKTVLQFHDLSF